MPVEIDNPFWQFSLRVYAAPGVAAECLELQDKLGLDVNIVLFAAWLGATRGVVIDDAALDRIAQEVAAWTSDVVQPLRSVRRTLKLMPQIAAPQVQALRKKVADVELCSEQIEQALLYGLATDLGAPVSDTGAARANILAILAAHGADATGFPMRKLLAAINSETGPA